MCDKKSNALFAMRSEVRFGGRPQGGRPHDGRRNTRPLVDAGGGTTSGLWSSWRRICGSCGGLATLVVAAAQEVRLMGLPATLLLAVTGWVDQLREAIMQVETYIGIGPVVSETVESSSAVSQ